MPEAFSARQAASSSSRGEHRVGRGKAVQLFLQQRQRLLQRRHLLLLRLARRRLRTAQHMLSLQAEFPVIHRSTLRFLFVLSFLTGLFKNKRRK